MPKPLSISLLAIASLSLVGCAATPRSAPPQSDAAGLPGITAYYEQATAPHRRAVRKPVRDAQARAMRLLAEKTAEFVAETSNWDNDTRLVSLAEPQRDEARNAMSAFRASLQDLQLAADRGSAADARQAYARVISSYHLVTNRFDVVE